MKEKIEEILESVDLLRCIETNPSNFWDSASYDDLVERLTTLIQEERKEAVEGFRELRKKMSYSYYEMSDDKNTGDWIEELDKYLESEK